MTFSYFHMNMADEVNILSTRLFLPELYSIFIPNVANHRYIEFILHCCICVFFMLKGKHSHCIYALCDPASSIYFLTNAMS